MSASRLIITASVACIGLLGGCAARSRPAPGSVPPSPEAAEEIRTSYKAVFPKARVGVVAAVLPDASYALVGDIDTDGLVEGDIVSFLDAQQTVIANGIVQKVEPMRLTVRFDAGQRRPAAGDVAVKF